MTQQIQVGATVKVTAINGGLFYGHNARKTGKVTSINRSQDHVRVEFEDGSTDYGHARDLTVLTPAPVIKVGDRIKVTAPHGGVFLSKYAGKEGVVTQVEGTCITARFDYDGGSDYGDITDLMLVTPEPRKANETLNGWAIGDKVRVNVGRENRGGFYERHERKVGVITKVLASGEAVEVRFDNGGGNDCGYTKGLTLVSRGAGVGGGWIANQGARPVPEGTLIDVKYADGLVMLNVSAGSTNHGNSSILEGTGTTRRYARAWSLGHSAGSITHYRLAGVVEAPEITLETELAALKAQHEAIKAEKATAERAVTEAEAVVTTKKAAVAAIEAHRVVLVGSMTKHGIQFIGETDRLNGLQAHEAGVLVVGSKLLCNVSPDTSENTVGKVYEVLRHDRNDPTCTFRLTSDDGCGFWVLNSKLSGYTLV